MSEATILDLTAKAILLVLLLSMPPILIASVVGIGVSLLQALTQVQEQTIGAAIKLVVVTLVLLLAARWLGGELFNFTVYLFDSFPKMVR